MANFLLAFGNRVDAGTLSAGSGSWNALYPLANLQNEDTDYVTRSASAAATSSKFMLDLGSLRTLRAAGFVRHNCTSAATWRIRGSASVINFTDPGPFTLDTGYVNVLQMTFQDDMPADWGYRYNILQAFAAVAVRYLLIEIVDAANPAGFIELGRFFVANGLQPAINADFGMQHGRKALDTKRRSARGKAIGTGGTRLRFVKFGVSYLTQSEADRVHEMQDAIGTTGEVAYIPDSADMALSQRYGYIGTLEDLDAIAYPKYVDSLSTGFEIMEKL